jgi:phosphoglycerate dehydrogenase-like enzyme
MAPAAQDNPVSDMAHSRPAVAVPVAPGKRLTVLIDFPLSAELVTRLTSLDRDVDFVPSYVPDGSARGANSRSEDGWRRLDDAELDAALLNTDVLFTFWPPAGWLDKAPRLKWVQLASAGADHILREGTLSKHPDIIVTTASGIHEIPISEHILAMILHFSRGFDRAVRNQQVRKWERFTLGEAYSKTVCFIGYGPIARRAATLCRALGMRVLAVRASLSELETGMTKGPVEQFYPSGHLNDALAESDFVVIAAPRTPRSEGMIGKAQLAAMKPTAILINISRGALVDEPELIEALQSGRLAGAGLDVFAQEPLPADSPLWSMSNVLITPHVSGSNPHSHHRATELFRDNLALFLQGQPLHNIVNVERGY